MDKLEIMMRMQNEFQKSLGIDIRKMDTEERVSFIKDMVLAATDELHEALQETSWKPWAQGTWINEDALRGELIDLWHFVMNLMLVAYQARPDEIVDRIFNDYNKKHAINRKRQEDGYDGTHKCPKCHAALDDEATLCRLLNDEWYCTK